MTRLDDFPKLRWFLALFALLVLLLFLLGFSIVLPLDAIVQATQSDNDGFNTFIVVGAIAAFGVCVVSLFVGNIYRHRTLMKDVPKRYLPITPGDLPHNPSRNMVVDNMSRSKELSTLFKKPKDPVIHPGLEPPARSDYPDIPKLLPEYLNYKICIKSVTDRLKYYGLFLNNASDDVAIAQTFTDIVKAEFVIGNKNKYQVRRATLFIELYETLRFSGEEVTREQFLDFAENCIYFSDLLSTKDITNHGFNRINTHSQVSFNIASNETSNIMGGYLRPTDSLASPYLSHEITRDHTDMDYTIRSNSIDRDDEVAEDDVDYFPSQRPFIIRQGSTNTVARRVPTNYSDDYSLNNNFISGRDEDHIDGTYPVGRIFTNTSKTDSFKTVIHNGE
ncbi:Defect at low temperature protein 1 [Nakaseomyces bracarensis]|uniref:Defect at low temperature protein 1 n=1 Tax=Nakaseomyces bracarensis TaxID=273131 RepID=A0ABR4NUY9_9SACH